MDEALDILDELTFYDSNEDERFNPSDLATRRELIDMCQRIANAINEENTIDV